MDNAAQSEEIDGRGSDTWEDVPMPNILRRSMPNGFPEVPVRVAAYEAIPDAQPADEDLLERSQRLNDLLEEFEELETRIKKGSKRWNRLVKMGFLIWCWSATTGVLFLLTRLS
jgi:hypothetical protein